MEVIELNEDTQGQICDLLENLQQVEKLVVTSESNKETIKFAKYLENNGVIKYSAYWCPSFLNQS